MMAHHDPPTPTPLKPAVFLLLLLALNAISSAAARSSLPWTNSMATGAVHGDHETLAARKQQQEILEVITGGHGSRTSAVGARTLLQSTCVTDKCGDKISACMGTPLCAQYLGCTSQCDAQDPSGDQGSCIVVCMSMYADNQAAMDLLKCAYQCSPPPPECEHCKQRAIRTPVKKQVRLEDLRGTYNAIYAANQMDCLPFPQQVLFPHNNTVAAKRGDHMALTVQFLLTGGKVNKILFDVLNRDATTGGYINNYDYFGLPMFGDVWYFLDATPDKQYILVAYCSYADDECMQGGYVLSRAGKKATNQLPAHVFKRFAAAVDDFGWSEDYGMPMDAWCHLDIVHSG